MNKPSVILMEPFAALAILISVIKLFLPDAVVNKCRLASNEKVKQSSSSVAAQSVKRPKLEIQRFFKTFRPFFFCYQRTAS